MKLKSLSIEQGNNYNGCPVGQYQGVMQWEGQRGETKIVLDPAISESLLQFIGPVIVQFAGRAAQEIANNIQFSLKEVAQQPTIEAGAAA